MGQIYSEGDAYRKAIGNPSKPIVLIGMWLLIGPAAIFCTCRIPGVFPLLWQKPRAIENVGFFVLDLVLYGCGALLFDTMLYRVTRNFVRSRRVNPDQNENEP